MVLISIVSGVCGSLKVRFIGGNHEKLIYRRESPKKGGRLGQFANLRKGALSKKRGSIFEEGVGLGGDTPVNTINLAITLTMTLIYCCQCPRC